MLATHKRNARWTFWIWLVSQVGGCSLLVDHTSPSDPYDSFLASFLALVLLGLVLQTVHCYFVVKAKGYHGVLSLLGALHLLGMAVIWLLPDRHRTARSAGARSEPMLGVGGASDPVPRPVVVGGRGLSRVLRTFLILHILSQLGMLYTYGHILSVGAHGRQGVTVYPVSSGYTVAPSKDLMRRHRSSLNFKRVAERRRLAALGFVGMLIFLPMGISLLMWLYRTHHNLIALGGRCPRWSPGWTVGGFFVPLLNIVWPFKVILALAQDSDVDESAPDASWASVRRPSVLGELWAVGWFVQLGLGALLILSMVTDQAGTQFYSVVALLGTLAAVIIETLAVFTIRRVEDAHRIRAERISAKMALAT